MYRGEQAEVKSIIPQALGVVVQPYSPVDPNSIKVGGVKGRLVVESRYDSHVMLDANPLCGKPVETA